MKNCVNSVNILTSINWEILEGQCRANPIKMIKRSAGVTTIPRGSNRQEAVKRAGSRTDHDIVWSSWKHGEGYRNRIIRNIDGIFEVCVKLMVAHIKPALIEVEALKRVTLRNHLKMDRKRLRRVGIGIIRSCDSLNSTDNNRYEGGEDGSKNLSRRNHAVTKVTVMSQSYAASGLFDMINRANGLVTSHKQHRELLESFMHKHMAISSQSIQEWIAGSETNSSSRDPMKLTRARCSFLRLRGRRKDEDIVRPIWKHMEARIKSLAHRRNARVTKVNLIANEIVSVQPMTAF